MSAPAPPGVEHLAPESPCLTAKQAAAYLHLNEKKLYELANSGEVPAARVGGKWLFPRRLLDEWLLEQAHGGVLTDRLLIAGGDDALLAAAVRLLAAELGAEAFVAYSPTTTLTGLEQLACRRVDLSAVHWGGAEHSLAQHATLLRAHPGHARWTLVRLGLREQGVLLRPGLGIDQLETLAAFDVRWGRFDLRAGGIRTIVWATGYRRSYPWLKVPVLDPRGEIRHRGGVTPAPGLFVLGMHFQRRRKSAFIDGVGDDARELAGRIVQGASGCIGVHQGASGCFEVRP